MRSSGVCLCCLSGRQVLDMPEVQEGPGLSSLKYKVSHCDCLNHARSMHLLCFLPLLFLPLFLPPSLFSVHSLLPPIPHHTIHPPVWAHS